MKPFLQKCLIWVMTALAAIAPQQILSLGGQPEAKLTFIGHASVKIVSAAGKVIYIDPYFPTNSYNEPADYILVTHAHSDHSNVSLCKQAPGCKVIRWSDALLNGDVYQVFEGDGVRVEAVPSGGDGLHDVRRCVGYIVTVDGVSVYHAGDVVMNDRMRQLVGRDIDYALYPVDGHYTMSPAEATELADLIGAARNIPMHGYGDAFYLQALQFAAQGKLFLFQGQTIALKKQR